ncbi:hypothetical protein [Roseovarius nanhaiticus]|uniref:hypothetical protein n=1 Tax=Roseovarius nanhaiticus TaxID=573024 RepID=UPI002492441A|nr:hypothetical protein [Roseovarius nanhaiticus]
MGRYYVNKGLLLDERDIPDRRHTTKITDLAASLRDHISFECPQSEDGFPQFEVLGITSERLDRSWLFPGAYARPVWIENAQTFPDSLCRLFKLYGLDDPNEILRLISAAPDDLERLLQREICQHVMAKTYDEATRCLSAVADFREVGLPCIDACGDVEMSGETEMIDMRSANHPAGTRIIAEVAYVYD